MEQEFLVNSDQVQESMSYKADDNIETNVQIPLNEIPVYQIDAEEKLEEVDL